MAGKQDLEKGKSFYTSIDVDLQQATKHAIGHLTDTALILDVEIGEVLAMASFPSFGINDLKPSTPSSTYNEISERGG